MARRPVAYRTLPLRQARHESFVGDIVGKYGMTKRGAKSLSLTHRTSDGARRPRAARGASPAASVQVQVVMPVRDRIVVQEKPVVRDREAPRERVVFRDREIVREKPVYRDRETERTVEKRVVVVREVEKIILDRQRLRELALAAPIGVQAEGDDPEPAAPEQTEQADEARPGRSAAYESEPSRMPAALAPITARRGNVWNRRPHIGQQPQERRGAHPVRGGKRRRRGSGAPEDRRRMGAEVPARNFVTVLSRKKTTNAGRAPMVFRLARSGPAGSEGPAGRGLTGFAASALPRSPEAGRLAQPDSRVEPAHGASRLSPRGALPDNPVPGSPARERVRRQEDAGRIDDTEPRAEPDGESASHSSSPWEPAGSVPPARSYSPAEEDRADGSRTGGAETAEPTVRALRGAYPVAYRIFHRKIAGMPKLRLFRSAADEGSEGGGDPAAARRQADSPRMILRAAAERSGGVTARADFRMAETEPPMRTDSSGSSGKSGAAGRSGPAVQREGTAGRAPVRRISADPAAWAKRLERMAARHRPGWQRDPGDAPEAESGGAPSGSAARRQRIRLARWPQVETIHARKPSGAAFAPEGSAAGGAPRADAEAAGGIGTRNRAFRTLAPAETRTNPPGPQAAPKAGAAEMASFVLRRVISLNEGRGQPLAARLTSAQPANPFRIGSLGRIGGLAASRRRESGGSPQGDDRGKTTAPIVLHADFRRLARADSLQRRSTVGTDGGRREPGPAGGSSASRTLPPHGPSFGPSPATISHRTAPAREPHDERIGRMDRSDPGAGRTGGGSSGMTAGTDPGSQSVLPTGILPATRRGGGTNEDGGAASSGGPERSAGPEDFRPTWRMAAGLRTPIARLAAVHRIGSRPGDRAAAPVVLRVVPGSAPSGGKPVMPAVPGAAATVFRSRPAANQTADDATQPLGRLPLAAAAAAAPQPPGYPALAATVAAAAGTPSADRPALAYASPAASPLRRSASAEQPRAGASGPAAAAMELRRPSAAPPAAAPTPQVQAAAAAAPQIDAEQLQQALSKLPQLNPEQLADKVYTALMKRMKFEQRLRGY